MLSALLLEGYAGPRPTPGGITGAIALFQRSILHADVLQQQCQRLATQAESHLCDQGCGAAVSDHASGSSGSSGTIGQTAVSGATAPGTGPILGVFKQQLLMLLHQQRGISTTATTSAYQFDSHLTRYAKAKITNRDNFQRWRDSGRDIRVAQEILREGGQEDQDAGGSGRRGRPARRGGYGGRRGSSAAEDSPAAAMAELRSMVNECRDLRELQVIVRECGRDMDAALVCASLHKLPKLKQATPASASPSLLANRLAESLMLQLQAVAGSATLVNLAASLHGLGELGAKPGRPLLEALSARLNKQSPRGQPAVLEASARTVSSMMISVAKMTAAAAATSSVPQRQPGLRRGLAAQGPQKGPQPGTAAAGAGEGAEAAGAVPGDGRELLAGELWPRLRWAAEVKLLRALGEEPPGVAAVPSGGEEGTEVDDSMPQASLRAICKALAIAGDPYPATWVAAARLTVRHVAELQPAVAASVLRSYAAAGGSAEDGGLEGLVAAVWGALRPQLGQLEVAVLLDLLLAANRLAATASLETAAVLYDKMVRPLCDAVATRVPSVSSADVAVLATGLAQAYSKASSARTATDGAATGNADAAVRPPPALSCGALPRLLADALLLRGPDGFGARGFYSVALALGLVGHTDTAFWKALAAAALPEVPRMDGGSLSRLLGAFSAASFTAAAAPAAPAPTPVFLSDKAPATPAVVRPSNELLAAAHSRAAALLDAKPLGGGAAGGGGAGLYGKDLYHVLRCLAEWPLPDGGAVTLTLLADRLMAVPSDSEEWLMLKAATPVARQQMAAGLRAVGLGEHPLVARLEAGSP